MQQHAKALKFAIVGILGTVAVMAAILLTFSIIQFAAPKAEATPAISGGKPCTTCHSSASPSKEDLKR